MAVRLTHAVGLADGHFLLRRLYLDQTLLAFCPFAYHIAVTTVRISIRFGVRGPVNGDSSTRITSLSANNNNFVGVTVCRIILMSLCVTPTSPWLHPHDLCPRTQALSQTCHVGLNEASLPRLVTHECVDSLAVARH